MAVLQGEAARQAIARANRRARIAAASARPLIKQSEAPAEPEPADPGDPAPSQR